MFLKWLFLAIMALCPISILAGVPRSTPADSKKVALRPTTKPFQFEIVVAAPGRPRILKNLNNRRCCRIGRQAARKGYSCYVTRDIADIRMNMPMRYKMKTSVHGEKWGYRFAKEMEFCAKTTKLTRRFNHCCDKVAMKMDRRKAGK